MTDCDYCNQTFSTEQEYLEHLDASHGDELKRIDKRRVEQEVEPSLTDQLHRHHIQLAAAALILFGAIGMMWQVAGSYSANSVSYTGNLTPTDTDRHYHGQLTMIVNGDKVDFSQRKYQLQSDYIHLENRNGEKWHGHASDVTLGYFMASLDIRVTPDSVTYAGTTYNESTGYNVSVTVDGTEVKPNQYVLQPNDRVRIIVTNETSS